MKLVVTSATAHAIKSSRRCPCSSAGFTLVEVLVTILVIALLLSIFFPALGRARHSGRIALSSNNLRQFAVVMSDYHAANDGYYPAVVEGQMYVVRRHEKIGYPHWQISFTWPGVIYGVFPTDENFETFVSPLAPKRESTSGWPSSYEYSTSFVGHPHLWRPGAPALGRYKSAQRDAAVLAPSNKALLWDDEGARTLARTGDPATDPVRVPTLLADSSVRRLAEADAATPVPNPFGNAVANRRLHNTPEGVLGRDFVSRD